MPVKKRHIPLAVMVNTLIVLITLVISLSLVAICDSAYREAVLDPYEERLRDAEIQSSALVPYLEHFMPYLGTDELQKAKEGADTGEDHLIAWMEEKPYSGTQAGIREGANMFMDWAETDILLYAMMESGDFDVACAEVVKDGTVYRVARCDRRARSYSSDEDFGLEESFLDLPAEEIGDPTLIHARVDDTRLLVHLECFALKGGEGRVWLSYDMTEPDREHRFFLLNSILYVLVLTVIASLVSSFLLRRYVTRPIQKLAQVTKAFRPEDDGHYSADAIGWTDLRPGHELGDLSRDIHAMQAGIVENTETLFRMTAEKERIGTELSLAARIQESMLPDARCPFPGHGEFALSASMSPAKEVGGDFYDFFLIDEDHLALVMADVSGKGIPGALFMMVTKAILKNNAYIGKSAAEILELTNDTLCAANRAEMFVTVWLGILELSTGTITAANAGHEYPAIYRASSGRFELFRDPHGFVLGGMADMRYKDYTLRLQPGDKLFVYTDGVPEAARSSGELFGTGRMLDALNENAACAPEELLTEVRKAVDAFVGEAEQFDDLTMLCLEYRGTEGESSGPGET